MRTLSRRDCSVLPQGQDSLSRGLRQGTSGQASAAVATGTATQGSWGTSGSHPAKGEASQTVRQKNTEGSKLVKRPNANKQPLKGGEKAERARRTGSQPSRSGEQHCSQNRGHRTSTPRAGCSGQCFLPSCRSTTESPQGFPFFQNTMISPSPCRERRMTERGAGKRDRYQPRGLKL